jgi:hypothetical protein
MLPTDAVRNVTHLTYSAFILFGASSLRFRSYQLLVKKCAVSDRTRSLGVGVLLYATPISGDQ